MSLVSILVYVHTYALWLYAIGALALLFSLYELRAAQRGRAETIFTLEKELATRRENRARSLLAVVLALLAVLTVLRFGIVTPEDLPALTEPTPTKLVLQPPTAIPLTPTPTVTRIPTRPLPTRLPPTETPTPTLVPLPPCPRPNTCIVFPGPSQVITGQVTIRGTAQIDGFQFYKIEYGMGEDPDLWNSIGDVVRRPVVDGTLGIWDTSGFPEGTYKLRLTVVDISGNFPPPHEVRVLVRHGV